MPSLIYKDCIFNFINGVLSEMSSVLCNGRERQVCPGGGEHDARRHSLGIGSCSIGLVTHLSRDTEFLTEVGTSPIIYRKIPIKSFKDYKMSKNPMG